MNKLQCDTDRYEVMNAIISFKELPKELQQYIRVSIYNKTDCYIYSGKCDWNKLENSKIGFQVYKDYYKCVSVYYIANDGYYSSVGIGKIYNNSFDLYNYTNVIYNIETIENQLNEIVTDKSIVHDYDYEQIQDALECGDYDLINDIVGDRDIFELI